jgi:hypothetical protein
MLINRYVAKIPAKRIADSSSVDSLRGVMLSMVFSWTFRLELFGIPWNRPLDLSNAGKAMGTFTFHVSHDMLLVLVGFSTFKR